MNTDCIEVASTDNSELESLLSERLYEFNSTATGIDDARLLWACVSDGSGKIVGGLFGHTWGDCCKISRLWVHASRRGKGLGTALMKAAEAEAVRRQCRQIVLSTHSFQAPGFYENLGFERAATIPDYPKGHSQIYFIKKVGQ